MSKEKQSAAYVLATQGDVWAMDKARIPHFLNTLIVSDMTEAEIDARTGPNELRFFDCEAQPLELEADGNRLAVKLEAALKSRKTKKAVAVLPLRGALTRRSGLFSAFFLGTSMEKWGRAFDLLVNDSSVGAIVLDVDSPGGTVDGTPELADKIFGARGAKPIVAVANGWMASAAYWLGSQADEIVVSNSGESGSIGVWIVYVNLEGFLEQIGHKVILISAGKYKTELNPYEPPSKEGLHFEQEQVDNWYGLFVDAVARGRGLTAKKVRDGFGEGRLLGPKASAKEGLADRIATLDHTIKRLGGRLMERQEAFEAAEERNRELGELQKQIEPPKDSAGHWDSPQKSA